MVLEYELDGRKDKKRLEEAEVLSNESAGRLKHVTAELDRTSRRIIDLNADAELAKKQRLEANRHVLEYESNKAKMEAEIVSLRRRVDSMEQVQSSAIDGAVLEAKKEMVAKFQEKLHRAYELTDKLVGEPRDKMLYLAQAEMNLQFAKLFQSGKPPDVEKEVADLTQSTIDLEGAHEAFDKLAADLRDCLAVSPFASDFVDELSNGEPIEITAGNLGIHDLAGSNGRTSTGGPLGLTWTSSRLTTPVTSGGSSSESSSDTEANTSTGTPTIVDEPEDGEVVRSVPAVEQHVSPTVDVEGEEEGGDGIAP